MSTRKKIKTAIRVRPTIGHEQPDNGIVVDRQSNSVTVVNPRDPTQHFKFAFQSCYDANSTQQEIYDKDVDGLLDSVYDGLTVTIFAYGVTSSGKTHTIQGSTTDPGIIPRVVEALFAMKSPTDSIAISYMEIYRDEVYDLLVGGVNAPKLPVRDNAEGKVVVPNLTEAEISSPEEFDKIYSKALKSRSVGATNLNHNSSRSHAILCLSVTRTYENSTVTGVINLVDLAGSENNKLTGNDPARMLESSAINKSLSVLGQVVHALNSGHSRIPYRDSKLTRILQDALGGNSIGLLICNLAPGSKFRTDTLNTLNFAARTKEIENRPIVNEKDTRPVPKAHFSAAGPSRPVVAPRASVSVKAPVLVSAPVVGSSVGPPVSRRAGRASLAGTGPTRVPRPSMFGLGNDVPGFGGIATLVEEGENKRELERISRAVEKEKDRIRAEEQIRLEERERIREEERQKERQRDRDREVEREEAWKRSHADLEVKIARAVEEEVARRLAAIRVEKPKDAAPTASGSSSASTSMTQTAEPPPAYDSGANTAELKKRLDALEKQHALQSTDKVLIEGLDSSTKKKNAHAYLVLARQHQENGDFATALILYRRGQQFIPQNVKLQVRIEEVELALANSKRGLPIPETVIYRGSRAKRNGKGRRAATVDRDGEEAEVEAELDLAKYNKSKHSKKRSRGRSTTNALEEILWEDERINRTLDGGEEEEEEEEEDTASQWSEEEDQKPKKRKRGVAEENVKVKVEDDVWQNMKIGKRRGRKGRA